MYDKLFLALIDCASAHAEASREAFSALSLSKGQPKILYILRRTGSIKQKELAALCGVREPTLTVLLSKTEEKGLVGRERSHTEDGKFFLRVFLTEKGRETAERLEEAVEALERQGFAGFSEEERENLLTMLCRVAQNMSNQSRT